MKLSIIKILLLTVLGHFFILALLIPLALDNYIPKIIPDVVIGTLCAVYLFMVYRSYIQPELKGEAARALQQYLKLDLSQPITQKAVFILSLAISATPGFVLYHGYNTSGPPGFFPLSAIPLMAILIALILLLYRPFLNEYRLFAWVTGLLSLEIIIVALLPVRSKPLIILYVTAPVMGAGLVTIFWMLIRTIIGSYSSRFQSLFLMMVLSVILGCELLAVPWIKYNYLPPPAETFPTMVQIGEISGLYVPVVPAAEFRYSLLSSTVQSYSLTLAPTTGNYTCGDFNPYISPSNRALIPVPPALMIFNPYCDPLKVSIAAASAGYALVIYFHYNQTRNGLFIPDHDVEVIPVIAMRRLNQSIDLSLTNIYGYTFVYLPVTAIWGQPGSFLLQCTPIIAFLTVLLVSYLYYLYTSSVRFTDPIYVGIPPP